MCFNYVAIKDPSGYINVRLSPSSVAADHNILNEHKWYRFEREAGGQMPTACVAENCCSTQILRWLIGSHPSREAGMVKREVCFRFGTNCCFHKTKVYVRQCLGYYVYAFQEVSPTINGRYCVERVKGICSGFGMKVTLIYIHARMHTFTRAYMHTYLPTYTYIHTYILLKHPWKGLFSYNVTKIGNTYIETYIKCIML